MNRGRRMSWRALLAACAVIGIAGYAPSAGAAAGLPASATEAASRLDASPRHGEWVEVKDGADTINSWLVYPERSDKAPVVIVIHEIYGLTDWIRAVADQAAAEGFIAIAPDLLSGKGRNGGGTESVDQQGAVKLVRSLDAAEVKRRLDAVARYGTSLPAATKKYGTVGFCWGGGTSFLYATQQPDLSAAVVYYGARPKAAASPAPGPPSLVCTGAMTRASMPLSRRPRRNSSVSASTTKRRSTTAPGTGSCASKTAATAPTAALPKRPGRAPSTSSSNTWEADSSADLRPSRQAGPA